MATALLHRSLDGSAGRPLSARKRSTISDVVAGLVIALSSFNCACWFASIVVEAPSLSRTDQRYDPIVESSKWWDSASKAYERYHCLTRPRTSSCAALARRDVSLAVVDNATSNASHGDLGRSCARGDGSSGSAAARDHCCSCGKIFPSAHALLHHRLRYRHPLASDVCVSADESDDDSSDAEAEQSRAERDIDDVAEQFLDECTELRYEQHISPANVQRFKDGMVRVTARQTEAVKRALRTHVRPGVNLDDLIDPIMEATDRYATAKREGSGRIKRQPYRVQPVRRSLGTHPVYASPS